MHPSGAHEHGARRSRLVSGGSCALTNRWACGLLRNARLGERVVTRHQRSAPLVL